MTQTAKEDGEEKMSLKTAKARRWSQVNFQKKQCILETYAGKQLS
jgi:hypothetical protein